MYVLIAIATDRRREEKKFENIPPVEIESFCLENHQFRFTNLHDLLMTDI